AGPLGGRAGGGGGTARRAARSVLARPADRLDGDRAVPRAPREADDRPEVAAAVGRGPAPPRAHHRDAEPGDAVLAPQAPLRDLTDRPRERGDPRVAGAARPLPDPGREGGWARADPVRRGAVGHQRADLRALVLGDRPRRADRPGHRRLGVPRLPVPADERSALGPGWLDARVRRLPV